MKSIRFPATLNSIFATAVLPLLALFAIAVCLSPAPATAQDQDAGKKKPNILFAFADDWGRLASAYAPLSDEPDANSVIKTPAFDRVAREGVLFTNAYVTAPSCTPCRSSLLSGQYFWRTRMGAILSGAQWDSSIPSYPLILRDEADYHIGQTYKVWSPGSPNDAPYGERQHEYESAGRAFNSFSQKVTEMVGKGVPLEAAKDSLYEEVLGNFESFLADREGKEPFCYWFGPTNVHRKWVKGSGKALWNLDPDDLKGKLPAFMPDVHEVREDYADYLGEAMAFDAALGHLLGKLEQMGEADNTIVVVSGDHGPPGFPNGKTNLYDFGTHVALAIRWPNGAQGGRVVTDFVNLMDLAPTFVEAGGATVPPAMTGKSLINVLKSDQEGRVEESRDHVITGRERHVGDAREGYLPYPHRAIRTDDFLYIRNFKPDRWPEGDPINLSPTETPTQDQLENDTRITLADVDAGPTKAWMVMNRDGEAKEYYERSFGLRPGEELYDLSKDPDQVHNLADDPAYADKKKALSDRLMDTLTRTEDPRVIGDGSTFDKPPYATKPEENRPAAKKKPNKPAPNANQ